MDIKGITVRKVLVGAAAEIVKEYYLGAIIDRASRRIVLMASAEGGVEIEEVARQNPGAIHRVSADPQLGLLAFQARALGLAIGLRDPLLSPFVAIAQGLYATMKANDADLVEVNPLAIVAETAPDGAVRPASGLPGRQDHARRLGPGPPSGPRGLRDLDEEDPTDAEARKLGINFIHLDGTIGCMVNGAGLAMTTMDLVKHYGGEPANFLDVGGGARRETVCGAMELILADPHVNAILVNIFGGITRGDEVAAGLIEARAEQKREVPMVVRIVGTNAVEAARLLRRRISRRRPRSTRQPRRRSRFRRGRLDEHPGRQRNAPRRPGHYRARGRVPHPRFDRLRHQGRGRHAAGQGRPEGHRRHRAHLRHRRRGRQRPAPTRRLSTSRRAGPRTRSSKPWTPASARSSASPKASRPWT
jgi:succinyl-CoA synthetase beta subunit